MCLKGLQSCQPEGHESLHEYTIAGGPLSDFTKDQTRLLVLTFTSLICREWRSDPAYKVVLKNTSCVCRWWVYQLCLATKAVQGAALALEGIDNVEGRHSLAASVLGVGHSVTHDVLQEHLL